MYKHVKFASLPVVDQDRALAFYRDVMGFSVLVDDASQGSWRWIELAIGASPTRLLMERRQGPPRQEPALVLVVEDVAALCASLAAKGVAIRSPAAPAPWDATETFALIEDSEGNLVQLGSA